MGIAADYNFSGQVANNLIYENTNQGILITNYEQGTYVNNTVYQPTGDAIDVGHQRQERHLQNNILWAAGRLRHQGRSHERGRLPERLQRPVHDRLGFRRFVGRPDLCTLAAGFSS